MPASPTPPPEASAAGTAGAAGATGTAVVTGATGAPAPASAARTIVGGGSWQVLGQVTPLVVNILLTPVVIAGLGMDRYGLFMLITVMSLVLTQVDGGVHGAARRFFAVLAGAGDRAGATSLLVSVLLVVLAAAGAVLAAGWVAAPWVIGAFGVPDALAGEGVYLLRAAVVIVAVAQVRNLFAALLNAQGRFALTNLNLLAGHAVYVVGLLVTLDQGWGLRGVAWTLLAQQALATVLVVPAALRLTTRAGVRLVSRARMREFVAFGLRVQWTGASTLVNAQADALIVGAVMPVASVGVLTSGSNFANQVRMVPTNVLAPVQAVLGRAVGQGDPVAARALCERVQHHWVAFTAGWGVVGACAAGFGVAAWLGPRFALSGVVAAVMLVGYLPVMMAGVLTMWVQVLGHPALAARAATVSAVVNVALTLVLIGPFGLLGTVCATALAQVLSTVVLLRAARRRLGASAPRAFWREVPLGACTVAAVAVVAAELALRPVVPGGALGLLVCGAAALPGAAAYAAMTVGPRRAVALVRSRLAGGRR